MFKSDLWPIIMACSFVPVAIFFVYLIATSDSVRTVARCSDDLAIIKVIPYEEDEPSYYCYRLKEEHEELVFDAVGYDAMPELNPSHLSWETVTEYTTYGCQRDKLSCR